jgi:beta-phosphoglucomutase-like phosphatase (HAD superfamily)
MLKAILWDNDGVLVDTEGLYFRACREALARLGIPLDEARYIECFLGASDGLARIAGEHGIDAPALAHARTWRNARYIALPPSCARTTGSPSPAPSLTSRPCSGTVSPRRSAS